MFGGPSQAWLVWCHHCLSRKYISVSGLTADEAVATRWGRVYGCSHGAQPPFHLNNIYRLKRLRAIYLCHGSATWPPNHQRTHNVPASLRSNTRRTNEHHSNTHFQFMQNSVAFHRFPSTGRCIGRPADHAPATLLLYAWPILNFYLCFIVRNTWIWPLKCFLVK